MTGEDVSKQVEKGKSNFAGCEIKGKTLGVIGLGAIGILVANAAIHLGMDVIGYDPFLSVNNALKLDRHVKCVNDIKEVFSAANYLTIHVPLLDSTRNTVNAETIELLPDGAVILNFARGGLVDNDAVKAALASGKVKKYVVDFPDNETINYPGIIAIPHLGASTEESEDNCAMMAADEIKEYLETGDIVKSVNFPNCALPMTSVGRVTVIHKNAPSLIAKFTDILSTVNIADMINKSKGNYAYTIINTDGEIRKKMADALKAVDGVIGVRVIK